MRPLASPLAMGWSRSLAVSAAVLFLVGCASPTTRADQASPSNTLSGANRARALVIALRFEPLTLTARVTTGGEPAVRTALFTAGLAYRDDYEVPHPWLTVAAPQLNTNDWRVLPDGRMETTYRLKPDLTWHDGVPLSAEDFVFAHRVVTDPRSAVFTLQREDREIEAVVAADPRTVVFHWRNPFQDAGALRYDPLPRHVLEKPYLEDDPEGLLSRPYWTKEFIHLGPYRLVRWEPGAFIEAEAFGGYALGRPKIQQVRLIWFGDANVAVTNLLAGTAHFAQHPAISYQEAVTLTSQWRSDQGTVRTDPNQVRYVQFQRRPEYANPPGMMDLRIRKALAHSVDKAELAYAMLGELGIVADTFVGPKTAFYSRVDRAAVKYPYDLRRAEPLMREAGFTRGPDGVYTHPTDGRLAPELRAFLGGDEERQVTILADGWRRFGVDVKEFAAPPAQAAQGEIRSTFPALAANFFGAGPYGSMDFFISSALPTPENRWVGNNRGGWSNPEFDQLYEQWNRTLDQETLVKLTADIWRVHSEDLAGLPLYFNSSVRAHVAELNGPEDTGFRNIHEWEWRS